MADLLFVAIIVLGSGWLVLSGGRALVASFRRENARQNWLVDNADRCEEDCDTDQWWRP